MYQYFIFPKTPVSLQDVFLDSFSALGFGYITNVVIALWEIDHALVILFPLGLISIIVFVIKRVQIYYAVCSICYDDPAARRVSSTTDDPGENIDGSDHDKKQGRMLRGKMRLKERQIKKKLNQRCSEAWELLQDPMHVLENKSLTYLQDLLTDLGVTSPEVLKRIGQEGLQSIASCLKIEARNSFIELTDGMADYCSDSSSTNSGSGGSGEYGYSNFRRDWDEFNSDSDSGSDCDCDISDLGSNDRSKRGKKLAGGSKAIPLLVTRRQSVQHEMATGRLLEESLLRSSAVAGEHVGRGARGRNSNEVAGKVEEMRPSEEIQSTETIGSAFDGASDGASKGAAVSASDGASTGILHVAPADESDIFNIDDYDELIECWLVSREDEEADGDEDENEDEGNDETEGSINFNIDDYDELIESWLVNREDEVGVKEDEGKDKEGNDETNDGGKDEEGNDETEGSINFNIDDFDELIDFLLGDEGDEK